MTVQDDLIAYLEAHPKAQEVKAGFQYTIGEEVVSVDVKGSPRERVRLGAFKRVLGSEPDVEVSMAPETWHEFLAGRLDTQMALYTGRVVIKGAQPRFLSFWEQIQ